MIKKLLRLLVNMVKWLLMIIASMAAFVILCAVFIFVVFIYPKMQPGYHDPSVLIRVINYTENPIKLNYIAINSSIFYEKKLIREGLSVFYGSRFHSDYFVPYARTMKLGINYTITTTGEKVFVDSVVDRSKYWTCMFFIIISDEGTKISKCIMNEFKDFD